MRFSGNKSYLKGATLKTSSLQFGGRVGVVQVTVRVRLVAFTSLILGRTATGAGDKHPIPVCVSVCVCVCVRAHV